MSLSSISLDQVRAALALEPPEFDPHEAQLKMAPANRPLQPQPESNPRLAATMLLLYPIDELHFVLTRRPDYDGTHGGQISFPGGRREADEDFAETALRETCEELGICDSIEPVGRLTELYIPPSDFLVYPYVGYIAYRPEWHPDPYEVAEVIETPLRILLDDGIKQRDTREYKGMSFEYSIYQINGHRVWGATAVMLSEFEWRLRTILGK